MNNASKIVKKILSYIYIVVFAVSFTYTALSFTMKPIESTTDVFILYLFTRIIIFYTAFTFVVVAVDFLQSPGDKNTIFLTMLRILILLLLVYNLQSGVINYSFSFLVLTALSASMVNENIVLRLGFLIGVIIIVVFFFLSMTGIIENNRGTAFGFVYRTHYACFLLSMALIYTIIKNGWVSWVGELGLFGLVAYDLFAVKGKTAFICLAFLAYVVYLRHYRKNKGVPYQENGVVIRNLFKLIYFPVIGGNWILEKMSLTRCKGLFAIIMKYSFVIGTVVTFLFTYLYKLFPLLFNRTMVSSTIVSRLFQNLIGLEEYPLSLFGYDVPQSGFSASEGTVEFYYAIDGAYAKALIQYGVVAAMILIGLMTFAQVRLYKNRRYFTMGILTIFAFDCILEYPLLNPAYNMFILLSFCSLDDKPGLEACNKFSLANMSKRWKLRFGIVLVFCCLVIACWCTTAYKITMWRGWTPNYNATIVVPGNNMEGNQLFLAKAKNYLDKHDATDCIVSSEMEKEWLVNNGIDKERVFVSSYLTIDDMLTRADDLIKENDLPARLTVCAYGIQMFRIEKHASALGIPINSLTEQPQAGDYVKIFVGEQWRLLWGK